MGRITGHCVLPSALAFHCQFQRSSKTVALWRMEARLYCTSVTWLDENHERTPSREDIGAGT